MAKFTVKWEDGKFSIYIGEKFIASYDKVTLGGVRFNQQDATLTANNVMGYYPMCDREVTKQVVYDRAVSKGFRLLHADKTLGVSVHGSGRAWLLSVNRIPFMFVKSGEVEFPAQGGES